MGTITKALQKHKIERAELAQAKPTSGPGSVPGVEAHPPKPPAAPKSVAGEVSGSHALRAPAGQPSDAAKGPQPAAALGKSANGAKDSVSATGGAGRAASGLPDVTGPAPAPKKQQPPLSSVGARKNIDPSLVTLVNPDGMEAELFRILRTRILFPQAGLPSRTILVTSAQAEEGKSFVAANLAINIARSVDQHVLLVDCDLRKPSIHTKFGFNGVKGLSEYLSAGVDLPALLLKSGVEKLTLLPSGAPPQNPSELITSSKMAALIQELRARYHDRYIIFDSPPPTMAPETSAIAKWVDGILLVVKYGVTPMGMVDELMTHIEREKIIGAVINKFNAREFRRYSYNKYYGYTYKSYSKDGRQHPA